jgi:hypothetical protein
MEIIIFLLIFDIVVLTYTFGYVAIPITMILLMSYVVNQIHVFIKYEKDKQLEYTKLRPNDALEKKEEKMYNIVYL